MSTSQTFRTNGMATHTYTHELGGRAVNIYFVHHTEVIMLQAQDGVLFPRWMYSKFAPDDHGTWFSARWRSEGIVSRATGGVIWTILILIQNDRRKKNERQKKTLLMVLVLAALGLRQRLPFRDIPMM